MKRPATDNFRRDHGLTLVELLIAMIIGIVITGGVLQIYVSSKTAYRVQEAQSRIQENGRFAIEFITDGLHQAGYLGCVSRIALLDPTLITNTLNSSTDFLYNFARPLEGFEATSSSAWSPALNGNKMRLADGTVGNIASLTNPPLGGTDVVSIRYASGDIPVVAPLMATTSASLQVAVNSGLAQNDIVVVSDCLHSAVMQISNADTNTSGAIAHAIVSGASPGNSTSDLGKIYQADARIYQAFVGTFYVAEGADAATPSLWELNNSLVPNDPAGAAHNPGLPDNPRELIAGVQDLQVLYGEDRDGDETPEVFVTADNVVNWNFVVSIRLTLLLQSTEDELAPTPELYRFAGASVIPADRRLRRVFSTTVAIRNRLP